MYGLYIHIPFCIAKCKYCDFVSQKLDDDLIAKYTDTLCKEIDLYKNKFKNITFDTVFIGGGTPSTIGVHHFSNIANAIFNNFNTELKEFTVEVNPATGSSELFEAYKSLGVNRISMGLQCANDDILKAIGRQHNVYDFVETTKQVKQAGINNFSADIMSGLPNQTTDDLISSINLARSQGAKHISMYTLKLEKGTPLYHSVKANEVTLPTQDFEQQMSYDARLHLKNLGYKRYEISNYAKENHASLHNLKYWQRVPYLGLGVAGSSCYDETRYTNTFSIKDYIKLVNDNQLPVKSKDCLTQNEIVFEMIMLSTRLASGLSYSEYKKATHEDFKDKYNNILKELLEDNLIENSRSHLILTDKGMDLQNHVLLKFMD